MNTDHMSSTPLPADIIAKEIAFVGPYCTRCVSTLRNTMCQITQKGPTQEIDEAVMARVLFFFSEKIEEQCDNNTLGEWNQSCVTEIISKDYESLDWDLVAMNFDFPEFMIRDPVHLCSFLELYCAGAKKSLSMHAMANPWLNKSGQLSFLENVFSVPQSIFDVELDEEEEKDAATENDVPYAACTNRRGLASSAVLQLLLDSISNDPILVNRTRSLFRRGFESYPDILLCALLRCSTISNKAGVKIKKEIITRAIAVVFNPPRQVGNVPAVIPRLWAISEKCTLLFSNEALRNTMDSEPQVRLSTLTYIIRILESVAPLTYRAKLLHGGKKYELHYAYAFYLADRNGLRLLSYLNDQIKKFGTAFVVGLTAFMLKNLRHVSAPNDESLLSRKTLVISLYFLRCLDASVLKQEISINRRVTVGAIVRMILSLSCSVPAPTSNSSGDNGDDYEEDLDDDVSDACFNGDF
mmetsp:Transcript_16668/g.24955  ORF Transcript_16668/g.24955 Transcript_16668/m.24955 type:complete len:468 (-) Transcript_16668:210-1613(-)